MNQHYMQRHLNKMCAGTNENIGVSPSFSSPRHSNIYYHLALLKMREEHVRVYKGADRYHKHTLCTTGKCFHPKVTLTHSCCKLNFRRNGIISCGKLFIRETSFVERRSSKSLIPNTSQHEQDSSAIKHHKYLYNLIGAYSCVCEVNVMY